MYCGRSPRLRACVVLKARLELARHMTLVSKTRASAYSATRAYGAGGRTRTGTVLLPLDFKSKASANSATPAYVPRPYINNVTALPTELLVN